jgi:outer membrane protein OmpA-like peptidoglycan-associated protein
MLVLILITTGMGLITPLILRDLIDRTIPNGDIHRLVLLALTLLLIPAVGGGVNVIQRNLDEGLAIFADRAFDVVLQLDTLQSLRNTEQMLTATFKSDVFFDVNSSVLKPGGYAELDRVAHVLNQYPQTMIRVEGHTDQTGSEQYNLQLSERRSNAVKNALIQKGVDPARVSAIGMGMCCPVSSDNAANRRVSMVLTGQA